MAVGEGDAALISLPQNKQILIDTGKPGQLVDKLKPKMPAFDREIEAVFLSHPDNDHIGSFEQLAKAYTIDKVYFNWQASTETAKKVEEIVSSDKIEQVKPQEGDNYYFGNLKVETLWPPPNASGLINNDRSLILKAELDSSKALFTGDIELKGQQALLNTGQPLAADLYKVPHHGSAGAFDENFLKKVAPKNAVISVGPNSYGHPSKTVLDGLTDLGVNIFRTDENGSIDFVASGDGWVKK